MTRALAVLPFLALAAACQPTPLEQLDEAQRTWSESGTRTYSYLRTAEATAGERPFTTFVDIVGGTARARIVTEEVDNVVVDEVDDDVGASDLGHPPLTMIELFAACRSLLASTSEDADIDLVTGADGHLVTCIVNGLPERGGAWTGIVLNVDIPRD